MHPYIRAVMGDEDGNITDDLDVFRVSMLTQLDH